MGTVGQTIALTGSSDSGLPLTYVSSAPLVAEVVNTGGTNTLRLHTEGSATITASQGGDDTYAAATDVVRTITVAAAVGTQAQTIDFTLVSMGTVGQTINLTGSSDSGLPLTYVSSAPLVAEVMNTGGTNTLRLHTEGSATITASQGGNDTYAAATDVVRTITVAAAVGMQAQTIDFTQPADNVTETVGTDIALAAMTDAMRDSLCALPSRPIPPLGLRHLWITETALVRWS